MKISDMPHNPFSLIADVDGDIATLFEKEFDSVLPVLPLRNMLLFPGVVAPVAVGRASSLKLVSHAAKSGSLIVAACQCDPSVEKPAVCDLYPVGVVAKVVRVLELPDGSTTAILQAYSRVQLGEQVSGRPYLKASVEKLAEELPRDDDREYTALADACKETALQWVKANDSFPNEAGFAIRNISNPTFLINFICTNLPFDLEEKAALLNEGDQKKRAYGLLENINREIQFLQLKSSIQNRTRMELDEQQRAYFLQQQMRNIQEELGEDANSDSAKLREQASGLELPAAVAETFERELEKLDRMNPQTPDYNIQLVYLQTIVRLPWGKESADRLDIKAAERRLNRDHYGMEKVKERILEHLAMLRFRKENKSTILCLYGPPGVGKTSLGRSIAEALGRRYVRVSLGGVHDEAEIRGHRRTYVGAMPGRIVKSLIKAGTSNPVFILDEIDKVSSNNYNGDPQSALLEVLDPEQNTAFHDNYLDLDIDLSKVIFIATANSLSTIPGPLLDRMELINVEGYLAEEKREIARRHLIPKELAQLNLEKDARPRFTPGAIDFIIENYTRESGVRQLEKQFDKIFRKIAYRAATEDAMPYVDKALRPADVEDLLGKPAYSRDKYQGNDYAGVVTGLAWTAVGGEILFIETSLSRSKGAKLTLTGNLGDVMKESAVLALEYVRAHAGELGIDSRVFDAWSIHVHVPEGATPKDGPSAGITMATSLASALTQRKVRRNLAMTGEMTLRGKVLPVGGIKEKILAAKRAGITDIVMSRENKKDIDEINAKYVEGLTFHFVESAREVFDFALLDEKVDHALEFTFEENTEKNQA